MRSLAEEPLLARNRDGQLGGLVVVKRERVDDGDETVRQRYRVDLLDEQLPGAERRERPGERDSLDVDGDADLVDLDGQ